MSCRRTPLTARGIDTCDSTSNSRSRWLSVAGVFPVASAVTVNIPSDSFAKSFSVQTLSDASRFSTAVERYR